jgi:hypothetical protein
MSTPHPEPSPESAARWKKLLAQARADAPPPVDVAALRRVVREAAVAPRAGWADEFFALFSARPVFSACLAGAGALALVATWQMWDLWQALPWAAWAMETGGGL